VCGEYNYNPHKLVSNLFKAAKLQLNLHFDSKTEFVDNGVDGSLNVSV